MKILILSCGAAAIVGGLYVLGIVPKDVLAGAIGLLLGLVFGLPVKLVLMTAPREPAVRERVIYRVAELVEPEAPAVTVWPLPQVEVQR